MSGGGEKRSGKKAAEAKFFAFLKAASLGRSLERDHLHIGRSYGRNHLFLGWGDTEFNEAIKAVREIRKEVSEKTVGRLLRESLVTLFEERFVRDDADPAADAPELESIGPELDSGKVKREIAAVLRRVKSEIQDWSTFVLVEGAQLEGLRELQLGAATLYDMDWGPLPGVLQEEGTARKVLEEFAQFMREKAGLCRCYLRVDVEGEKQYVSGEAIRRAEDVAGVLKLYAASVRGANRFYQRLGVVGQPAVVRQRAVLQRTPPVGDSSNRTGYFYTVISAPQRRYKISQERVRRWKEFGLDRAVESMELSEGSVGSADSRIRRAITWYARALNANTLDEQFVGLIVGLESLLVGEDSRDVRKAQRLADQASMMLGGNLDSRERISKATKALYRVRGQIVHQGVSASEHDLVDLDDLVVETIVSFVKREMDSS